MTKTGWILCVLCGAVALGGCEQTRDLLGQTKKPPDEFAIYTRAPLSLPPDYGLRPPDPGARRPQESAPRNSAAKAVLGRQNPAAGGQVASVDPGLLTSGMRALLTRTGAIDADPGIRATVNRETSKLVENDQTLAKRILFWKKGKEPGSVVDPVLESKRIRENQALGRPITTGDTPVIERKTTK